MEKGGALHLNNCKFPSHKDALCQVWLKLAQWFWRRGFFFNFVNIYLLFRNYLPLVKRRVLHLNQLESPSPKEVMCQVWLNLAKWFWRRRWKCEKFMTIMPKTMTDIGQILIRKAHWSLQLRWAKNQRLVFSHIQYTSTSVRLSHLSTQSVIFISSLNLGLVDDRHIGVITFFVNSIWT